MEIFSTNDLSDDFIIAKTKWITKFVDAYPQYKNDFFFIRLYSYGSISYPESIRIPLEAIQCLCNKLGITNYVLGDLISKYLENHSDVLFIELNDIFSALKVDKSKCCANI